MFLINICIIKDLIYFCAFQFRSTLKISLQVAVKYNELARPLNGKKKTLLIKTSCFINQKKVSKLKKHKNAHCLNMMNVSFSISAHTVESAKMPRRLLSSLFFRHRKRSLQMNLPVCNCMVIRVNEHITNLHNDHHYKGMICFIFHTPAS
jgi:hypothetical protein